MTEPAPSTRIAVLAMAALIAVDLWEGPGRAAAEARLAYALEEGRELAGLGLSRALPGGWRCLRVEPTVWWLVGPLEELDAMRLRLRFALGDDGADTDLSGGFARLEIAGPAWREPLMIGGVFDAEAAGFGRDRTVGTLLHHIGVRYDVVDEDRLHIHVAPSYRDHLLHHLEAAIGRL